MAQKNKTFKRQAEATRLLEKIGATRRKSRKAGITVTGNLKESLRGRQSTDVANALKFTANTALDEAEELYNDLIDAVDNVEDKTSQKLMQEYLSKYSEHIHSLHKAVKSSYRSLRVANRLEDVLIIAMQHIRFLEIQIPTLTKRNGVQFLVFLTILWAHIAGIFHQTI